MSFWRPYGLSVHDPLYWLILSERIQAEASHAQSVWSDLCYPRPLLDIADAMRHVPREWRDRWCDASSGCACAGATNCSGARAIQEAGQYPVQWAEWMKWQQVQGVATACLRRLLLTDPRPGAKVVGRAVLRGRKQEDRVHV